MRSEIRDDLLLLWPDGHQRENDPNPRRSHRLITALPNNNSSGLGPSDVRWLGRFDDLDGWYQLHAGEPRPHNAGTLSRWVVYQRQTRSTMCAVQSDLLMLIGFCWDPIGERWDAHLDEFKQFLLLHRRRPSRGAPDPAEARLATWLRAAERSRSAGTLPAHYGDDLDGELRGAGLKSR